MHASYHKKSWSQMRDVCNKAAIYTKDLSLENYSKTRFFFAYISNYKYNIIFYA